MDDALKRVTYCIANGIVPYEKDIIAICEELHASRLNPKPEVVLLDKKYDGESIVDMYRDVAESVDDDFTPEAKKIPSDEYGFHQGEFRVTVTWHS